MNVRKSVPKVYIPYLLAAQRAGWEVTITGGGHLKWLNPDGRFCFTPATPGHSNGAGILRIERKLRKAGLRWQ